MVSSEEVSMSKRCLLSGLCKLHFHVLLRSRELISDVCMSVAQAGLHCEF